MSDWYYAKDNDQKGPVNESELKAYLVNNQIPPHTLVWKEGMANWLPANEVSNFIFRAPPAPARKKTSIAPLSVEGKAAAASLSFSLPGFPPVGEAVVMDEDDVEKNKVFGILAYLWVLVLVPLLAASDSPFAKYHANQGLVLFILWIGIFLVVTIFNIALAYLGIPYLGAIFFLAYPVHLVFVILGLINAAGGKAVPLPVIGGIKIVQ